MLLQWLTQGLPVTTESYGTLELDGLPALPEAVDVAASLGVDLGAHRARPVASADLGDVDLLIGFEDEHVHVVAPREPFDEPEQRGHDAFTSGSIDAAGDHDG